MEPITCDCQACRAMCEGSTCLPTPDEARALVSAGYGSRLAQYRFMFGIEAIGPAPKGQEGARGLTHTRAACTFYSDDGCELHAAGLKPLEGRLAHHSRDWRPIRLLMAEHWQNQEVHA